MSSPAFHIPLSDAVRQLSGRLTMRVLLCSAAMAV